MKIRRVEYLEVSKGILISYVHNSVAEGLGRLGVLVALETGVKNNDIKERISFYCASNNCGREESIFKVSVGSNFPQLVFCICKN